MRWRRADTVVASPMLMLPVRTLAAPTIAFSSVLLPDPLGPSNAMNVPGEDAAVTSQRAWTSS
jgi:hypothetical protein